MSKKHSPKRIFIRTLLWLLFGMNLALFYLENSEVKIIAVLELILIFILILMY